MYEVRFARDVEKDLRKLLDQLLREPTTPTKHRKLLVNLVPPWTAEPPVWELRVGEHRVFYDVAESERVVYVRAVRRKRPRETTEDIL